MPTEYSLPDVLERLYQNQLALEAAVMELTYGLSARVRRTQATMSAAHYKRLERTPDTSDKALQN
jgi:hypothetical protein